MLDHLRFKGVVGGVKLAINKIIKAQKQYKIQNLQKYFTFAVLVSWPLPTPAFSLSFCF